MGLTELMISLRISNSCFLSFHSLSYSSSARSIELGIGLIELGIGLRIHVSCHFIHYHIHYSLTVRSMELGMGLIELGIGLKIDNAGAPSWPVYLALLLHKLIVAKALHGQRYPMPLS